METVSLSELRQSIRARGAERTIQYITECLELGHERQPGGMRPDEFSIRDLAIAFVGQEWVDNLSRGDRGGLSVMESGAVNSAAFANITGQIIYSRILQAYEDPAFTFSSLIPTQSSTLLDGERIPGMTRIGDKAEVVHEGDRFPEANFDEDWIDIPAHVKKGLIVSITDETIIKDRTGLVIKRADEVGTWLGFTKEKELCDLAIGAINRYSWRGNSYNTYQTATPWINDHGNPMVDWTDLDASEQLFANMLDPHTREHININANQIVVCPAKWGTAKRILNATEIRVGDITTGTGTQTLSANPVAGVYNLQMSKYMYSRLQSQLSVSADNAKEYWLHGDFGKAFAWVESRPLQLQQQGLDSNASFERDIVARFKASRRGVAAVLDPRYVVRNKN